MTRQGFSQDFIIIGARKVRLSKTFLESHGANAIRQAKERRHFHYVLSDSSFVCSCMFFDLAAYDIIA